MYVDLFVLASSLLRWSHSCFVLQRDAFDSWTHPLCTCSRHYHGSTYRTRDSADVCLLVESQQPDENCTTGLPLFIRSFTRDTSKVIPQDTLNESYGRDRPEVCIKRGPKFSLDCERTPHRKHGSQWTPNLPIKAVSASDGCFFKYSWCAKNSEFVCASTRPAPCVLN